MAEQSNVGIKHDGGKPDMALIPSAAAFEEAIVWTDGKTKYSAFNWHNGIKYMRILAGIERHLTLLKAGISYDYEKHRHHAAAIRCGCAMLIQFDLEGRTEFDDRIVLTDETKRKLELMAQGESIFEILQGNEP